MNWIELFTNLEINAAFFEPASKAKIEVIKNKIDVEVSGQLMDLLLQTDGIRDSRFGDYIVFSSEQIVKHFEITQVYFERTKGSRPLLFFAGDGCGDYFSYEILDGKIISPQIRFFEPISPDERVIVAPDLYTWATKWFTDKLQIYG
jgi:hypothetical protein